MCLPYSEAQYVLPVIKVLPSPRQDTKQCEARTRPCKTILGIRYVYENKNLNIDEIKWYIPFGVLLFKNKIKMVLMSRILRMGCD